MKSKKELIEEYLQQPLKVGDKVELYESKNYSSNRTLLENLDKSKIERHIYEILRIPNNFSIEVESRYNSKKEIVLNEFVANKLYRHIGVNPFPSKMWQQDVRFTNRDLEGILFMTGYDRRTFNMRGELFGDINVQELNWNPYFLKNNGEKIYYQRDFVWLLNDKQLLIESIINGIEIGKILIRKRSFEWIENQLKLGNLEVAFKDIVDGKQRLNTILGFVQNEFCDIRGDFYKEYSDNAKYKFMSFMGVSFGEMGEKSTDEDVKATFLGINFAGVQMSQEHLEYVKQINLK